MWTCIYLVPNASPCDLTDGLAVSLAHQETSGRLPSCFDESPRHSDNAVTATMHRRSTTLPVHPHPRLRLLAQAPERGQPTVELVITSTPWLKKASDFAVCIPEVRRELGNVNIYCFEPWQSVDDGFAWPYLLNFGNELANTLLLHLKASQVRRRHFGAVQ